MHESRITLQVVPEVHMIVDDQLQVVDGCIVITTAEIQGGNFVVEYQYAVMINICRIFFQFFVISGTRTSPSLNVPVIRCWLIFARWIYTQVCIRKLSWCCPSGVL